MNIPSVTPVEINEYTKKFNNLANSKLENLFQLAVKRDDILPCVQRDAACLLQLLIRLTKPARILELGTGIGVSTIIMASAMDKSGQIITIEFNEKFAREAKKNFTRFQVQDRILLHIGDAVDIVPQLSLGFDLIFQDSGKQTYPATLDQLVQLLKPGGLLICDDTLFPAMDLPERNRTSQAVIDRFNRAVKEHPLLESYILPIGHGVTVARKQDTNEV